MFWSSTPKDICAQLAHHADCLQGLTGEGSAIDLDMGPSIDAAASKNYRSIKEVLERLTRLCVQSSPSGNKPRKHEQRLLRNMGAHSVVLELLQIPYEKVGATWCQCWKGEFI